MKARKIDLRPYKVSVNVGGGIVDKIVSTQGVIELLRKSDVWTKEEVEMLVMQKRIQRNIKVREWIGNVICSPQLRLSGLVIYERGKLRDKIKGYPSNDLLLEESEYNDVKSAFQEIKGLGPDEMELLRRVFEAEQVEVKEDKKKGKKKK